MAFISGKEGHVKVSTVEYKFGKWKASFKTNLPKVNNFTSAYQQLVSGLTSATLTIEGPYDNTAMAFTAGTEYTFLLGFTNTVELSVPAIVESIESSQDIEDAARVTITAQSTGTFTAAIV